MNENENGNQNEPLLQVKDLVISYGFAPVVDQVSLHVSQGEAVALLGANGAGKTSTLRAISGLIKSSGSITLEGTSIGKAAADVIARRGVIHVPEGRRVFASLTAEENLLIGTSARNQREPIFELNDIYELFPQLGDLKHRKGWALSGGEQQMVAIGRGLMAAPRVLLLDEPSLGLAPIIVKAVYTALSEVRKRVALLIVEQNAQVALAICDRAYVLAAGKVVLDGPASALNDRDQLLNSYLARAE